MKRYRRLNLCFICNCGRILHIKSWCRKCGQNYPKAMLQLWEDIRARKKTRKRGEPCVYCGKRHRK